jgi:hypothetical protein
MRGRCNILVALDGSILSGVAYCAGDYRECGKPSVFSSPEGDHWCADHYDAMTAPAPHFEDAESFLD